MAGSIYSHSVQRRASETKNAMLRIRRAFLIVRQCCTPIVDATRTEPQHSLTNSLHTDRRARKGIWVEPKLLAEIE
jgi:hypothetical protein